MSNKPDFVAYGEKDLGRRNNSILIRIGAAWRHKEGNGVGIQVDALPLDFNGKIVLLEPKQDGQPAGSNLEQRGGRLMIRSAQAAGTRAAQAALNPAPDTDLDRFLLIEELDDVTTDIRVILCDRFPRGLEVPS